MDIVPLSKYIDMNTRTKLQLIFFFFFLTALPMLSQLKIQHGPYLQAVGETEATIVWTTSDDAVSWVELADGEVPSFYEKEHPAFYQTSHGKRVIGRLHRVKITGLEPGNAYKYRVYSQAVVSNKPHQVLYGEIAATDVYRKQPLRFRTLDPKKPTVTAHVVNDIHGKTDNLRAMLQEVTFENSDLVFFNGDMASHLQSEEDIFTGFMDTAVELFASEVPMFFARGNHEARGAYSMQFPEYFPAKDNKLYYSFQQGPVFFIVLDCGEDKPDSDIEYSGLSRFDEYRTEQQVWLRGVVESDAFKQAPFRVVILHIPPVGTWHGPLDLQRKFLPVLDGKGVDIMLSGHTHNYRYITSEENPGADFPILINDDETALELKANRSEMVIEHKDMSQKVLNRFVFDAR